MHKYPKASRKFDLLFVTLGFCLNAGVFIDGWAHNHLSSTLETFFTPWHAFFYAAFTAIAVLLVSKAIKNYRAGFKSISLIILTTDTLGVWLQQKNV